MSGFMQEQVTHLMEWWKVDGPDGTSLFPVDDFSASEAAGAYEFPSSIQTIDRIVGYGARMSAPGYMDCTEWTIFDTAEEAAEYLRETFGDDDDESDGE